MSPRIAVATLLSLLLGLRTRTARRLRGRRENSSVERKHPLSAEVIARPYNLVDELRDRRECRLHGNAHVYRGDEVVGLSIARAGSESVALALKRDGTPSHHWHECGLADYARKGARRFIVSLRDPVARLISGYQRRMEMNHVKYGPNLYFTRHFKTLDAYVDALYEPENVNHSAAFDVTYGGSSQNFMLPIEEFYLGGLTRGRPEGNSSVAAEVCYACIESLDDDLDALLRRWGLTRNPREALKATNHRSRNASDALSTRRRMLSDRNERRILATYAADAELHHKFCSDTARTAAMMKCETFVVPARLARNHSHDDDRHSHDDDHHGHRDAG